MTATVSLPQNIVELDGILLADALRAGIYRLFAQTDHINKINVFPVPDGDTGTNMSMTLQAVLIALNREPQTHAGHVLTRAADAALDGARGNSGAILAQFLLGLGDGAGHLTRLGVHEFVAAVGNGARYAREALIQPREGTLLTVLREFAEASEAIVQQSTDFRGLFTASLVKVHIALEQTRHQLDELRAANVVDAGALGFVEVLEGISRYLESGEIDEIAMPLHAGDEVMAGSAPVAADQDFRYCTECLITARADQEIDLRSLRERMAQVGASLVVSGSKRKAKVHIHVDDPEGVFRVATEFGELTGEKADDMRMQQSAAHHRRTQTVVVATDSGADIPDEFIERLGIHVVPARVHFGNESHLDKVSMTAVEFYRELAMNPVHPKTSQPPPGDFRRMFEFLVSHYDAVVSINLTARHSGTYNAARTAAQRISLGEKSIEIIDSRSASIGEGLVVIAAAEAAAKGQDAQAVAAVAQSAIERTQTFALLKDINFAVRGGRVPAIVGKVAKILRLNVILKTYADGRVAAGGGLIGQFQLRRRFVAFVRKRVRFERGHETLRILVGHGDAREEGEKLLADLRKAFDARDVEFATLTDMGAAVGVHGGPGTLIVSIQRQPR
jgi:DegV family protein with EDD domain